MTVRPPSNVLNLGRVRQDGTDLLRLEAVKCLLRGRALPLETPRGVRSASERTNTIWQAHSIRQRMRLCSSLQSLAIAFVFINSSVSLPLCQASSFVVFPGDRPRKKLTMATTVPPPPKKNVPSTTTTSQESAVLAELKETIRKQKLEIEKLKKHVSSGTCSSSSPASHGAHGGGGSSSDDISSYMDKSFLQIAHQRAGWLSLFLVSLSVTAIIVNGFEHTLSRQIELAFFMPLLAGHGGNTGGQSVGTILSALSANTMSLQDAPKVILKEACSGLTVGLFLGTVLALVSHFIMGISIHVSTCLCCTLPLVSLIASTLGASIPFLCLMLNLEPSVIAAPAMTSFVDVAGLLSYFLIAHQVFHGFGLEL